MSFRFVLISFFIIIFYGCGKNIDITEVNIPSTPVFCFKLPDSCFLEDGIDAYSGNNIIINWHSHDDDEVKGYEILRMLKSDSSWIRINPFELRKDTFFIDKNLPLNEKISYKILAVNSNGGKSDSSFSVNYRLLSSAKIEEVNYSNDSLYLSWSYSDALDNISFSVRFYKNDHISHVWISDLIITEPLQKEIFDIKNLGIDAKELKFRIDVLSDRYEGSETSIYDLEEILNKNGLSNE